MSNDTEEIPVEVKDEEINQISSDEYDFIEENVENDQSAELSLQEIQNLLEKEQQKSQQCEDKLKRTLADFQNLERKSKSDIQNGLNMMVDEFMMNFIQIYDDFNRAIEVYTESKEVNTDGLNSILKNMNSLLSKYNILPIEALGEIFDPKLHEAISIVEDESLDEGTITKEIRKGYISQNRVIRPTLVEISKTSKEKTNGEKE